MRRRERGRARHRSERLRALRERIAKGRYDEAAVLLEIARRILASGDL